MGILVFLLSGFLRFTTSCLSAFPSLLYLFYFSFSLIVISFTKRVILDCQQWCYAYLVTLFVWPGVVTNIFTVIKP